MAVVHGVLVFSFFTKGLYQILALCGHFLLPDIPLQVKHMQTTIIYCMSKLINRFVLFYD